MAAPVPVWSWTGLYIGAHVGAGWGTVESEITDITGLGGGSLPLSSRGLNGFLGGVQAGYNWQAGPVVLGIEANFSGADIKGTAPCLITLACSAKINWMADIAGRIGFAAMNNQLLMYVKGGANWADTDYSARLGTFGGGGGLGFASSGSDTRLGALLGMGAEYAFAP
ncbi:MAG: porin family protein, partial [Bradyrhizobium sp.]